MDSTLRSLCYLQLVAVLMLIGYIVIYLPNAFEWNRLAVENGPRYETTVSMIRNEGVTGERKDIVARLLEMQVARLSSQPRMYRATFGAAASLAVLISILPMLLLLRDRKDRSNYRQST